MIIRFDDNDVSVNDWYDLDHNAEQIDSTRTDVSTSNSRTARRPKAASNASGLMKSHYLRTDHETKSTAPRKTTALRVYSFPTVND